jgi:hypothetical protein
MILSAVYPCPSADKVWQHVIVATLQAGHEAPGLVEGIDRLKQIVGTAEAGASRSAEAVEMHRLHKMFSLTGAVMFRPLILTNSDGKPWTSDGFRASWGKACKAAGVIGVMAAFYGVQPSPVDDSIWGQSMAVGFSGMDQPRYIAGIIFRGGRSRRCRDRDGLTALPPHNSRSLPGIAARLRTGDDTSQEFLELAAAAVASSQAGDLIEGHVTRVEVHTAKISVELREAGCEVLGREIDRLHCRHAIHLRFGPAGSFRGSRAGVPFRTPDRCWLVHPS